MPISTPLHVSIIIVSWNTCEITCNCLRSIFDQTSELEYEVIIIDNNSSDNSVAAIEESFPQVQIIANKNNVGFGKANNQGMQIAKGGYFLLINSDTIVLDNAIKKTYDFATKHLEAGVVGCRVLNSDMSLQPTCYMFPSILNRIIFISGTYKIFKKNRFFGREQMTWWNRDTAKEVDVVTGCFMLLPRKVYEETAGFDERFFMYCEETDWCWRIKNAGWKCLFTPDGVIIHLGGASAAKYGPRRAKIKDDSTIKFMYKHWTKKKAFIGVIMMFSFYLSRLLLTLPLSFFARFRKITSNHLYGIRNLLTYYNRPR